MFRHHHCAPLLAAWVGFILAQGSAHADSLEPISAAGGFFSNMRAHGDVLYVMNPTNLGVYDLRSGGPVAVAHLPLNAGGRGAMAVGGNTLAVAGYGRAVSLFDVTDRFAPIYRGGYDADVDAFGGGPGAMSIHGSRLIVASGSGQFGSGGAHIEIVDITELAAPQRLGTYDLWPDEGPAEDFDAASDVECHGDAIHAATYRGVLTLDATDPTSPRLASRIPLPDIPSYLTVSGTRALSVSRAGLLSLFDLSSPFSPRLTGSLDLSALGNVPLSLGKLPFDGTRALVPLTDPMTYQTGVQRIDFGDPAHPVVSGDPVLIPTSNTLRGIGLGGDRLITAIGTGSRTILRTYEAGSGAPVGSVRLISFLRGGHPPAFYDFDYDAFWIVSALNPFLPIVASEQPPLGQGFEDTNSARIGLRITEEIYEDDPYVLFTGLYDLSDPFQPRRAALIRVDTDDPNSPLLRPFAAHASGNNLIVSGFSPSIEDDTKMLQVLDITDLGSPAAGAIFGFTPEGGDLNDGNCFAASGDFLYVSGRDASLQPRIVLWNIADRAAPVYLGPILPTFTENGVYPNLLEINGNNLAMTLGSTVLGIADITDPAHPVPRFTYAPSLYSVNDYEIDGDFLYVCTSLEGDFLGRLEAVFIGAGTAGTPFFTETPVGKINARDGIVHLRGRDLRVFRHDRGLPSQQIIRVLLGQREEDEVDDADGNGVVDIADFLRSAL